MSTSRSVLIFMLLTMFLGGLAGAGQKAAKQSWGDLEQEFKPWWTVRIALVDGSVVQGESPRLTLNGLTMRVEKSSPKTLHPKGPIFIPREQVNMFEFRTNEPVGRAVDRRFRQVQVIPDVP